MVTSIEASGPLVISGSSDKMVALWDVRWAWAGGPAAAPVTPEESCGRLEYYIITWPASGRLGRRPRALLRGACLLAAPLPVLRPQRLPLLLAVTTRVATDALLCLRRA